MTAQPFVTYMRVKEIAEMFGVSERTIWRWHGEGRKNERGVPFPKPHRLSRRVTCFSREEVLDFARNAEDVSR